MKIETIEMFGFSSAFRALRLPFKNKDKSDTKSNNSYFWDENNKSIIYQSTVTIGPNDLLLAKNLVINGDEHAKVIRGINITCSITAPRYWWQEMDTYRFGTERLCSESTMHVEAHSLTGEELQKVKGELKEGFEQERIQMFSYQTLRRIYFQRKNHRLPEWKIFIQWIEFLPLANELIFSELKHYEKK